MAIGYLDRDGAEITKDKWKELRADEPYKRVRLYDNGVVHVELEWIGRITDLNKVWPDYYKVIKLTVQNYGSTGKLVPDPVDQDKFFPNQAAAIKFYEEFLTKWTNSGENDVGIFQEADNLLTPPEPEDPNRPESVIQDEAFADVGSW